MTTETLPFDGGPTPEPPSTPAIGHWVTIDDDAITGDDAGEIIGQMDNCGVTFYFVVFKDDGVMYHFKWYPQEFMEFVGYADPNA